MVAEGKLGAANLERLHCFGRVHVLIGHEPSRLVGADRQESELERTVASHARCGMYLPSPYPESPTK